MFTEEISTSFDIVKPEIDNWTAQNLVNYFKDKAGYENVPDFMIRDVFKSYFSQSEEMKYQCPEYMHWWHEMLQNVNNYLLKTVTQEKEGHSFIAMKHIIKMLRDEIENDEDFKNHCNNPDGGDGDDQGDGNAPSPNLDSINDNLKNNINQAIQDATEEIEQKENESDMTGSGPLSGMSPEDIQEMEEKAQFIDQVIISKKQVAKFINKSIKGFKKGFGTKSIMTEDSLFEADVIEDLLDEHYLFDNALALDVCVRDTRQQMVAFDLYIDVSGSMSNSMPIYGKNVRRIQMAIALAVRMQLMGCLGNVYAFNNNIKSVKEDRIWHLNTSGGTSIEKCMQQIKKLGRPSVVLTDGDDGFATYTENAFIMSISPSTGSYYMNQPAVKKMVQNRKYIQYDGKNLITPRK